jgi:hypothetical protein
MEEDRSWRQGAQRGCGGDGGGQVVGAAFDCTIGLSATAFVSASRSASASCRSAADMAAHAIYRKEECGSMSELV